MRQLTSLDAQFLALENARQTGHVAGLAIGDTAVYTKIHHAVIDGVSGAEITGMLLDLTADVREVPPPDGPVTAGRKPGQWEMLGRAIAGLPKYPLRVVRALATAVP